MQAFVDIPICEELFERLLPLANHRVVSSLWADDDVLKGPSIWLHSELSCVADMLASIVASRVTNNASVTVNALAMLTEFSRTASLTVTLQQFPMRTPFSLALTLTWDAPLPTVTVPVDIEFIGSTATFTGPTNEELFSISIVRSHSEYLGVIRVDYITTTSFL